MTTTNPPRRDQSPNFVCDTTHTGEKLAVADVKFAVLTSDAKEATDAEHAMTLRESLRKYPKAIGWSVLLSLAVAMEGYGEYMSPTAVIDLHRTSTHPKTGRHRSHSLLLRIPALQQEIRRRVRAGGIPSHRTVAEWALERSASRRDSRSSDKRHCCGEIWVSVYDDWVFDRDDRFCVRSVLCAECRDAAGWDGFDGDSCEYDLEWTLMRSLSYHGRSVGLGRLGLVAGFLTRHDQDLRDRGCQAARPQVSRPRLSKENTLTDLSGECSRLSLQHTLPKVTGMLLTDFLSTVADIFLRSVCPVVLRAYLTTWVNFCWGVGQLAASGALRGFLSRSDQWAYRIPYALQWMWPVPLVVGISFAPDSPWWLVRRTRYEDARKALQRLTSSPSETELDQTIAMMRHTDELEKELSVGSSYLDCFKGVDLRRTEITCLAWACQPLCGASLMGFSVGGH